MLDYLRDVDPGKIESTGSFILFSWVAIIILLERFFPYKEGVKLFRKGFWLDLIWYTIIQSYFLKIIIFSWIIAPLKTAYLPEGIPYFTNMSILELVLFFLFTHDLYIYLFHRLQHTNKYLWRTHEAHHSVRQCDWLAGSRSHFVEILINQTIEFLPIFLLLDVKTAAVIVPIKALLDAIFGIWIHANINFTLGPLRYFINTPVLHQWHHANHNEVFYSNYATKFSVFDWVFKTAYAPKDEKHRPILYGLPYQFPNDFFLQSAFSFKRFDLNTNFIRKWESFIVDGRRNLFARLAPAGARQFFDKNVFDADNHLYEPKFCPKCNRPMKQFCDYDRVYYECVHCDDK